MTSLIQCLSQRLRQYGAALLLLLLAPGCAFFDAPEVADRNNPDVAAFVNNPSLAQVQALASGTEASLRLGYQGQGPYLNITGTFGREVVVLATNESRWYTELLGSRPLDNAAFYNSAYPDFARARRAAQLLRESANTAVVLSAEQKQAVQGFAHTIEALAKLYQLNLQGDNSIRIDVDNPLRPGPFVSATDALANIRGLLEQGNTELGAGSTAFPFTLTTSGFAGFDTPATFRRFNRALAARVAAYRQDWPGVTAALAQSFYSETGSLTLGPAIAYTPGQLSDTGNPYFQALNANPATLVVVQRSILQDTARLTSTGRDNRVRTKLGRRSTPRSLGGITGSYQPTVYTSNTARIGIIRNEELILLAAEAAIQQNNATEAVRLLNVIRTRSGGVGPYAGATTQTALIDELLLQREFSLYYEGHRWIDYRRYNRLGQLDRELPTHQVYAAMARPFAEVAWDAANP
jgi:starch-binding outer membrane protein, SusD/RagB family